MKTLPDISDLYPQMLNVSNKRFLRYGKSNILNGEIETVFCTDDNSLVKSILAEDGRGRILVIDAAGVNHVSMIGDQIAAEAVKNNWQGVVLNGYIRDVTEINDLPISIIAKGSVFKKTEKFGLGKRGEMISFAGLIFKPGYWLYADENNFGISRQKLEF